MSPSCGTVDSCPQDDIVREMKTKISNLRLPIVFTFVTNPFLPVYERPRSLASSAPCHGNLEVSPIIIQLAPLRVVRYVVFCVITLFSLTITKVIIIYGITK